MTTCDDYGSNNGCDENCPVLWEGNCEVMNDMNDMVEWNNFLPEEEKELLELYGLNQEKFKSIW